MPAVGRPRTAGILPAIVTLFLLNLKSQIPPSLPDTLPPHLKDLAGLIARSHGIPLRDTFPYSSNFGKH